MPKIPQKLKDDRREAILQAAVESLARYGLQGTSMRTIAEAVGLTKGGLYPYFENKEAILVAASERYLAQQLTLLEPREGVGAARQLVEFIESFMLSPLDPEVAAAQRGFLDLWLAVEDVPAVRGFLESRYRAYHDALVALVRRGQEEGAFGRAAEPELVAALILAARDGMVIQHVKLRAPIPLQGLTALVRDLVLERLSAGKGNGSPRAAALRRAP